MKIKRWAGLTAFFVLTACQVGYGFIYEARVLKKWDPSIQSYRFFIGLSDFHDKAHEATSRQLQALEQLLSLCNKDKTRIMLEDLSSRGSQGRQTCGRFVINSRGGILGGLVQRCQEKNLAVDNMEYRYCRVSSLGPVLNNLKENVYAFPSVQEISVAKVAQEIHDEINEIRAYRDGPLLNSFYQQGIEEVREQLVKLRMNPKGDGSVADYLMLYSTPVSRLDVLKRLLTFDSGLLDLKLVHNVVNVPQEKVLAIAGGSHIGRVSEMLEKAGYQVVYKSSGQFVKEYDLKRCLGSTIVDKSYCLRPDPIDLRSLNQFMQ